MAQETLVVFIYVVVYQSIVLLHFCQHALAETHQNLLQNRLVEHQTSAMHHQHHVITLEQVSRLQYYAVGTGRKSLYPQTLVQNLACKYQYLQVAVSVSELSADVHAHRGAATQPQVQQNHVGHTLPHQFPQFRLVLRRTYNCCLRNLALEDMLCAFQFQLNIFDDNNLEFFHSVMIISLFSTYSLNPG